MTHKELDLETLNNHCRTAVAIRRVARLLPADGGKVYPPTYEGSVYAWEDRRIDGDVRKCVILDSVQSQANRCELALLAAARSKKISLPIVAVSFGDLTEPVTSLEAPHRYSDALLRDSTLDNVLFRKTEHGKVLDTANNKNATGLLEYCPTALLFGLWDSAGPRGGLGTKFARVMVSEIYGVDVVPGARARQAGWTHWESGRRPAPCTRRLT